MVCAVSALLSPCFDMESPKSNISYFCFQFLPKKKFRPIFKYCMIESDIFEWIVMICKKKLNMKIKNSKNKQSKPGANAK